MIETLTAAAIANLAFDGVIQAGAGKLTEAALAKCQQLWQKIRGKVKEEGVTEAVLVEVENKKSLDILEQQVVPRLREAILKDPQFAQEIQNIAQQFNQEIIAITEAALELAEKLEQGKSYREESVGILKAGDSPKRIDYWQGRVEEIEQLNQWLADENIRLIGIEGIGGTGKSILAAKIYEEIEEFPKRFWADVSSGATIFSDLARRVLTDFGCPTSDSLAFNQWC